MGGGGGGGVLILATGDSMTPFGGPKNLIKRGIEKNTAFWYCI